VGVLHDGTMNVTLSLFWKRNANGTRYFFFFLRNDSHPCKFQGELIRIKQYTLRFKINFIDPEFCCFFVVFSLSQELPIVVGLVVAAWRR